MQSQRAWHGERKKKLDKWTVPYLPIDPKDVGRTYEADVIRINSQSGKGGVAYILKQSFGINVPQQMREQVGYMVKQVSDEEHKELSPDYWGTQHLYRQLCGFSSIFHYTGVPL